PLTYDRVAYVALMSRLHASFPLFRSTTLFRSQSAWRRNRFSTGNRKFPAAPRDGAGYRSRPPFSSALRTGHQETPARSPAACCRSEEHTSELQSRENLVCRLLLEKQKCPRHVG